MPSITLDRTAVLKLMDDPKLRSWRDSSPELRVPFLGYFRRSYTTTKDGTVTEHGDGFMLSKINPHDPDETKDILIEPVSLPNGLVILVGGDASVMSESFTIGWAAWRFTYEPQTAPGPPARNA